MRISDWSSDVCSSDLMQQRQLRQIGTHLMTACAVVGGFALAACGDNNGHSNDGSGANGTSFAPIAAASTDAAKRAVIGTDFATLAGKTSETGHVPIPTSGQRGVGNKGVRKVRDWGTQYK